MLIDLIALVLLCGYYLWQRDKETVVRFSWEDWWYSLRGVPVRGLASSPKLDWNRLAADYAREVYSDVNYSAAGKLRLWAASIWCLSAYALLLETFIQALRGYPVSLNPWFISIFGLAFLVDLTLLLKTVSARRKGSGILVSSASSTVLSRDFTTDSASEIENAFGKAPPELPVLWMQNSTFDMYGGLYQIGKWGGLVTIGILTLVNLITGKHPGLGAAPTLIFDVVEALLLWLGPLLALESTSHWNGYGDKTPSFALGILYRDLQKHFRR